jgi:hypothetical protein
MPALPPAPPSFDRIKASIYVPDLGGMSEMQRRFCEEYLQDLRLPPFGRATRKTRPMPLRKS